MGRMRKAFAHLWQPTVYTKDLNAVSVPAPVFSALILSSVADLTSILVTLGFSLSIGFVLCSIS
jgi:hypothetical protein